MKDRLRKIATRHAINQKKRRHEGKLYYGSMPVPIRDYCPVCNKTTRQRWVGKVGSCSVWHECSECERLISPDGVNLGTDNRIYSRDEGTQFIEEFEMIRSRQ